VIVLVAVLVVVVLLAVVAVYDLTQSRHAILRNFPVVGHLRFILESVGPELRQYIVTSNDEERPFSRNQRRWVYATSKKEISTFGFGTDNSMDQPDHYLIIKHHALARPAEAEAMTRPVSPAGAVPGAKVMGARNGRRLAFRPPSVVNISGMSFGALSGPAIEALSGGARLSGCLQNTGEGGVSPHHLAGGGDLVWQIGTGYFGCRDEHGRFDLARVVDRVAETPVRAIEIKLSQGAKPGLGGMLPGAKVTEEIAAIRGIPVGVDCVSPPFHTAFGDVPGLVELIETIADATGLPVGIKSAVGERGFWVQLALHMASSGGGPDFLTIDGGEGGTGAAPLVFADHVSLPFTIGFSRVYRIFAEHGLNEGTVFVGSGKLGFPESAVLAMALGCDSVSVGREAMLSIGCIQAQRCHTGRCPTGVATQNRWLARGLDPEVKSHRAANYVMALRYDLQRLARACGQMHPAMVGLRDLELLVERHRAVPALEEFGYEPDWGYPSVPDRNEIRRIMLDLPTSTPT
jgi:glutamate synthase domain-containing protein 2